MNVNTKQNHKRLLERILKNNNSRKNNISKQISKLEKAFVNDILKSPCPDYSIGNSYKLLYAHKDEPEFKDQAQKKLDELALCIYNNINERDLWYDNMFIDRLQLDPTIHRELIDFLLKKHSVSSKKPNNI
jgi:hypothetical protein